MTDRIGSIHLKQFIGKLIENESTRTDVLALVDRHLNTVKSDQKDLVNGLQELLKSPEDGKRNTKELIERFGKMPKVIFSGAKKYNQRITLAFVVYTIIIMDIEFLSWLLNKQCPKGN